MTILPKSLLVSKMFEITQLPRYPMAEVQHGGPRGLRRLRVRGAGLQRERGARLPERRLRGWRLGITRWAWLRVGVEGSL